MDDECDVGEDREDDVDGSPMSVSNIKRGPNNTTCVTSPKEENQKPNGENNEGNLGRHEGN
jgi:hypothetical protein